MKYHVLWLCFFFFFQAEDGIRDTSVTGVQTCALPIWVHRRDPETITNSAIGGAAPALDHDVVFTTEIDDVPDNQKIAREDRKSTRLNSSHRCISYAVFCLKKKKKKTTTNYGTQ